VRMRFSKLLWALMLPALLVLSPIMIRSQSSRGSASVDMERDFQAAMAAEDRGDLDRAEALLSKLHTAHPGIFAVNESLGLLYAQRGKSSQALPLLEAAVREQPSSDAAHANLGAALYSLHRNSEAIAEFQRAIQLKPSNGQAQQSLGRVLIEEHRSSDAARALTAALRLSPGDADLQLDCVTALLAANRLAEARKILSNFADADHSARAQALIGEAYEQEKDFSSAARHFTRAVELEPSEENVWLLSLELLQHWTFGAAEIELKAASAKFPDSIRMRLGLGAAYFGDTKYPQAIAVFADLLESEPENATVAEMLGISCNAVMETISPRCAVLVAYAQAHPADAKAAAYAASFLLAQIKNEQNVELARKLLEHALVANPNLPEAQFQMGVILQNDLDWKGSIPYLERAVKLKPDFAQAHYRLARAYWRTGRKQDGQAQMELQKKFASQKKEDLDQRLRQLTTFIVDVH